MTTLSEHQRELLYDANADGVLSNYERLIDHDFLSGRYDGSQLLGL